MKVFARVFRILLGLRGQDYLDRLAGLLYGTRNRPAFGNRLKEFPILCAEHVIPLRRQEFVFPPAFRSLVHG